MGPGMALMALGVGTSAFGSILGGRQERGQLEYNAALMEQRADATRQAAERETEMMTDRSRKMKASQTAAFAKSGAMLGTGTPLTVMAEQSADMQRDILQQRRNRMIEEQQLRSQAEMARYQAKQASRAGLIGGAGTILGGAGQMAPLGN